MNPKLCIPSQMIEYQYKKRLQVIPGTKLDEKAINKLEIFKISSTLKFIQSDIRFLVNLLKVSEADIDVIKTELLKDNTPKLISACEIYKSNKNFIYLSTGIPNLDEILNGGLSNNGYILEICGISGVGKSFLSITIALNFAIKHNVETIFIDTKHDITGKRFYNILKTRKIHENQIKKIMNKIKIERAFKPNEFLKTIKNIPDYAKKTSKFKLLIIDSLPALYFLFHNDNVTIREIFLSEIANIINKLRYEYKIIIIIINIVTRWIEDIGNSNNLSKNIPFNFSQGREKIVSETPSLGQYWCTIPSTRIQMDFVIKNINDNNLELTCKPEHIFSSKRILNKRGLKIIKSNTLETGKFTIIEVSDSGF
ncbi:DNA repair protein RAD51 homolog 3-like isoform X2 [Condylostylus longicornis]|uniref:DNA repair protein RAD51 homolog 3-like isoform X2 n=1 Tax=Condylostylus longicornis TaxID=2530218 RepID=UPI00244E5561|nr:DNA repair protein RAD51 homolog 3-like isoform X2 [Condylostylus longicornis]